MNAELKTGDVVLVDLNPSRGSEQFKQRPCVVIESEISPLKLVIVLPLTDASGKTHGRLFVSVPNSQQAGLGKPSVIDCYQIRAIDRVRIQKVLGSVDEEILDQVRVRLAAVLDIGPEHTKD